jgi:hypothetical protein
LAVVTLWLYAIGLNIPYDRPEPIRSFQKHIDRNRIERPGPVSDLVEQGLARMGHLLNTGKGEEPAATLKGVHGPKNIADQLLIVGSLFQLDEISVQLVKDFARLKQELI